jgi:hypothetical protein
MIMLIKEKPLDLLEASFAANSLVTQSILFDKKIFSISEARNWLKSHDKKSDNIDVTDKYYRARQRDPGDFISESFRTIKVTRGIFMIVGKLKD